jgi:hypothetical protein
MKKENDKWAEKFLGKFSFKPAPSMLKQKILSHALQRQKTNHVMTAHLWKGLVGCLFFLIFVLVVDATITHSQNKRFASILQQQKDSRSLTEEERSIITEIIMDFSDSTKSEAKIKFFGLRKKKKNTRREWDRRKSFEEELE